MNKIAFFILVLISNYALSCEEINGDYVSVSETHWNFVLNVKGESATLLYTDHWYGVRDTRTDISMKSSGYCKPIDEEKYEFVFSDKTIIMEYHKLLSHKYYGAEGSSPGLTGNLIEGQLVHLWKKSK